MIIEFQGVLENFCNNQIKRVSGGRKQTYRFPLFYAPKKNKNRKIRILEKQWKNSKIWKNP